MNNAVSLSHSAQYLKKAVPMMVKYRMPVTPINYAIWYCYFQGNKPSLNIELDQVISEHQTCTQSKAKEIFDKHLSDEDLALFQENSAKLRRDCPTSTIALLTASPSPCIRALHV